MRKWKVEEKMWKGGEEEMEGMGEDGKMEKGEWRGWVGKVGEGEVEGWRKGSGRMVGRRSGWMGTGKWKGEEMKKGK